MEIKQTVVLPGQPEAIPPAYFHSISIENVKCFAGRSTLKFLDKNGRIARWTVILGENGIGKTTVLQCLAGLCVRPGSVKKDNVDHPVVSPLMTDSGWFGWHESIQRINTTNKHSIAAEILVGSHFDGLEKERTQTVSWESEFEITRAENFKITVTEFAAEPKVLAGLQCYAYGAGRRMSRQTRTAQQQNPSPQVQGLFRDDVVLPNAEEWLLELDHVAKTDHPQKGQARAHFEKAKELLISVLPHVEDIRVAVNQRAKEYLLRLEFQTPYGWVQAHQLSFGYQTIVAWVVDLTRRLCQRYPDSSNPVAEPAIVLIDELDLHLHPRWQIEVMSHLTKAFSNTQFIVTAHSPLIVQSDVDANIILLERDGDRVLVNNDIDMVKNWRVDQILTSDLFKLDSARPRLQVIIDERTALLSKSDLSAADNVRLKELNALIHQLPIGESKVEREAEAIIKDAAAWLRESRNG